MKKSLLKTDTGELYYYNGDEKIVIEKKYYEKLEKNIRGNVSSICGDVSSIRGDVSYIRGDVNDCELTEEDRKKGVNVEDLLIEE